LFIHQAFIKKRNTQIKKIKTILLERVESRVQGENERCIKDNSISKLILIKKKQTKNKTKTKEIIFIIIILLLLLLSLLVIQNPRPVHTVQKEKMKHKKETTCRKRCHMMKERSSWK